MSNFKKTAISILLCVLIISLTGCSRKNTNNETEQNTETGLIIADFTTANESDIAQLGNFIIYDEILVLYTGNESHVEIPASLKINSIGSAFAHSSVVSVIIPEQVETIEGAFYNCYYLQSITVAENNKYYTSVDGVLFNKAVTELIHFPQGKTGSYTIPGSITAIDWRYFSGCSGLTSISIPAGVTRIEDHAFNNCTSLTSITVDQNNNYYASADGVLFNKNRQELIWFPHGKTGSYTMPDTVTRIRQNAFSDRSGLTSVTISNSVASIGDYTFSGCRNLASVTISNSVTSIGSYAFSGCTSLTSITIPFSVTSIGDNIFNNCTRLTSITVDENNTNYVSADGVLFNKAMTELVYFPQGKSGSYSIPDTVTIINDLAFSDRTGLTSVTIPASVLTIGTDVFFNCISLSSITVDENNIHFTSTDGVLFNKAKSVLIRFPRGKTGQYTIPNTVLRIENNAFAGSRGLTSVTIPSSVISIGDTAFAGTGLTSLTLPNTVESIGNGAFEDNPGLTIVGLPDNYYSYGDGKGDVYFFYGCTGLRQILASRNNKNYSTVDGVLFNKDRTVLIRFPQGKTGSYTIPKTVTSIAYKAFYGASGLTSINIPASVTSIGDFAFDGCTGLVSVNIPNSVINIGKYAFTRCSALASVNIPASVTSIGDFVFYECTGLRSVTIDQNNRTYTMANGMLFKKDMTESHRYLAALNDQ